MTSTALLTDHYELTMLDAALRAGVADQPVHFEVFARRLPAGRGYGVFAGSERLVDAIDRFVFDQAQLEWISERNIVSEAALEWLASYRFDGDIHAYPEGELYTGGSPVLTVSGGFGQTVLLETLVLSILNHDSAVAAAASLISRAAGERPVIEMGSRRTDPDSAVAAARAAYIGGLASTSNLEAGRRYGVPTAGTVAHSFVLLFQEEEAAFRAQLDCLGPDTTLLVDTYDTDRAVEVAVKLSGARLGAIRIDSGNLGAEAARARARLDSLGAVSTRIIVTGDLDEKKIRDLAGSPVDGYGAGTCVVTGAGHPSAGFIYKLVSVAGRPVGKRSPGKATSGGRKWAWRLQGKDLVGTDPSAQPGGSRPLQVELISSGRRRRQPDLEAARVRHRRSLQELDPDEKLSLLRLP